MKTTQMTKLEHLYAVWGLCDWPKTGAPSWVVGHRADVIGGRRGTSHCVFMLPPTGQHVVLQRSAEGLQVIVCEILMY